MDGLPDNDDLLRYGHQLQFTCKSGFKLVGPKDVICGENGVWNNPSPVCEGKNMHRHSPSNRNTRACIFIQLATKNIAYGIYSQSCDGNFY